MVPLNGGLSQPVSEFYFPIAGSGATIFAKGARLRIALVLLVLTLSQQVNSKTHPSVGFEFNVDQLFQAIQLAGSKSVLEAVSLFDDRYFDKGQYALVFDSRSPQTSSPEAPRVLLFGKNKHLRVGFNHHGKHGQDLEMIQWRELTRTWEFREIKFTKKGPVLSRANPRSCLHCHRDHKPKFDGFLMQSLRHSTKKLLDISSFAKKIETDPIYRRLENPPRSLTW